MTFYSPSAPFDRLEPMEPPIEVVGSYATSAVNADSSPTAGTPEPLRSIIPAARSRQNCIMTITPLSKSLTRLANPVSTSIEPRVLLIEWVTVLAMRLLHRWLARYSFCPALRNNSFAICFVPSPEA